MLTLLRDYLGRADILEKGKKKEKQESAEFNGGVNLFCFRSKTQFFGKFGPKIKIDNLR